MKLSKNTTARLAYLLAIVGLSVAFAAHRINSITWLLGTWTASLIWFIWLNEKEKKRQKTHD